MLSAAATVRAEDEAEARETVRIGQYDCWEENGEYYTVYEDEIYQVIDLDELTPQPISETGVAGGMLDWQNDNFRVVLTEGKEYKGSIDISEGDDYTPIFLMEPQDNRFSVFIKTKFIFRNKYNVTVFTYNNISGWDNGYDMTIYFGMGAQKKKIFTGTASQVTSRCCVYFHKDGSDGEEKFNYWAYYSSDRA